MLACGRCGAISQDVGARFCGRCGASLELNGRVVPAPTPPVATPSGPAARCAVHPEREAFEVCPRCGAFACADCLDPRSREPRLCAACTQSHRPAGWLVPWEARAERGWLRAFWQTAMEAMGRPQLVFGGLDPEGPVADALKYGMLSHVVGLLVYLVIGLIGALASLAANGSGEKASAVGAAELAVIALVVLVMVPAGGLLRLALGPALDHLFLLLLGGGKQGFRATVRAYCYSMASPLGLIPICGCYLNELARLVLSAFAYRGVHRMSGLRAGIAVTVPWLLSCFSYTALIIFGVMVAN